MGLELGGIFKAIVDPVGTVVEAGGKAMGLSQEQVNVVKLGAGLATGNVIMALNGGIAVAGDVIKAANAPAKTEVACSADPAKAGKGYAPPPAKSAEVGSSSHASTGAGSAGSSQKSNYLDPNLDKYKESLHVILENWDVYDTSVGKRDEYITRDNLRAIANNPNASAKLREAAKFLLNHPEYFNRLEMAAGVGGKDGIIGKGDVVGDLARVDKQFADAQPKGPVGTDRSASTGGSSVRDIINDPSLSIEDKIQMILARMCEGIDSATIQTMNELEAAQDNFNKLKDNPDAAAGANRAVEALTLKLQKLIERRKLMIEMMSTLSEKFNEMAKCAVANMGKA